MILFMGCIFNTDLYQDRLIALQDYDNDGFSIDNGDCNDDNPEINPSADEVCDWLDNNCNGAIDDLDALPLWFLDRDEDGFGDPSQSISACFPEDERYTAQGGDCDDTDAKINPDSIESWENAFTDNDCNNQPDQTDYFMNTWSPFLNLSYRGYWAEGGVALMLKNQGSVIGSIHWLRSIEAGISLTPLMMATEARQAHNGHLLVQHYDEDASVYIYNLENSTEPIHQFVFADSVLDMEGVGDVTGDGIDDMLVYFQNTHGASQGLEYWLVLTSIEGYPRVDVTTFDWDLGTPYDLLDGDFQPADDWDGDGLSDVLLHHSDDGHFSMHTGLDEPDLLVPYTYVNENCMQINTGYFRGSDAVSVACMQAENIQFFEPENAIGPESSLEILPPVGGHIQGVSILDSEEGGAAVLYAGTDARSSVALIHPDWLASETSYVISGLEPHVYSEEALRQIHYLGPVHLNDVSTRLLLKHESLDEDWIGLFKIPDL